MLAVIKHAVFLRVQVNVNHYQLYCLVALQMAVMCAGTIVLILVAILSVGGYLIFFFQVIV
ncbi:hypothetical protein B0F86_05045 [Pseudomonas syringae]|nr:hypothetical protein CXB41_19065 [Pseudomonas syringae pv. syringae]PPS47210.1 hypothetical protein B0F86_05045 [Pseudomonas syringae]